MHERQRTVRFVRLRPFPRLIVRKTVLKRVAIILRVSNGDAACFKYVMARRDKQR